MPRIRVAFVLAVLLAAPHVGWAAAEETPGDLSDAEKIHGLSLLWQEANYNFAFFDQVPDLDWDATYRAFIPQVLATDSTYEYYRVLQRFMALLGDGHTSVWLPRGVAAQQAESYPWILPHNVQGRALVKNVGRSLEKEIPIGSEILTVDGVPVRENARDERFPYIASSTEYVRWDKALEAVLEGPAAESVAIAYVTPGGERRKRAMARDRRTRDDEWLLSTSSTRPRFEHRRLEDGIAYVALNTFNEPEIVADFEAALPDLYEARALIIDVRHNGGGNSGHGYRIAAYLTNEPLATSSWRTRQHIAAYKAWGGERYGEYAEMNAWLDGGSHGDVEPAEGRRLIVPTVVLQDHETYSAAEDFLVVVDTIPHVTTVGRPSAGSTGQPIFFDVPGGGRARIVTKRDTYPDGRDFVGVGAQPDVIVEPTVEAVQAGRDLILERAMEILTKR